MTTRRDSLLLLCYTHQWPSISFHPETGVIVLIMSFEYGHGREYSLRKDKKIEKFIAVSRYFLLYFGIDTSRMEEAAKTV